MIVTDHVPAGTALSPGFAQLACPKGAADGLDSDRSKSGRECYTPHTSSLRTLDCKGQEGTPIQHIVSTLKYGKDQQLEKMAWLHDEVVGRGW